MEKKVILSGIQATGDLHLGHYIGVLKRFVEMQEKYNCYYLLKGDHWSPLQTINIITYMK